MRLSWVRVLGPHDSTGASEWGGQLWGVAGCLPPGLTVESRARWPSSPRLAAAPPHREGIIRAEGSRSPLSFFFFSLFPFPLSLSPHILSQFSYRETLSVRGVTCALLGVRVWCSVCALRCVCVGVGVLWLGLSRPCVV